MNSNSPISQLKVFLSHAQEDKPRVKKIYKRLQSERWLSPWLDIERLLGGQDWKLEINKAIRNAGCMLVFVSELSIRKEGYVQSEIKTALEVAREKPEGSGFLIPILLDDSELPKESELSKWQSINCNKKGWYEKLLLSLRNRAEILGVEIPSSSDRKRVIMTRVRLKDWNLDRFHSTLSQILLVNKEDIKILRVQDGNVRVVLEMPDEALRELAYKYLCEYADLSNILKLKVFAVEKDGDLRSPTLISRGLKQFSHPFVGRESELEEFERILTSPNGKKRILFLLGGGGIGKTKLITKMLRESTILAPENPLDLSTTQLRSIDGIQLKIIEVIETLTGLKEEQSPFAEFFKDNRNTSEQFNRCLREFCKKTPLVLAFDTFEVLGTVASNWLFAEGDEGLQVPGLVCIVAGRSEKENLQRYTVNPLVKPIEISGFTIPEIEDFYQKIVAETSRVIAAAASVREEDLGSSDFRHLQKITNGHPLKLEMAFRWAGTILSTKSLVDVTYDQFEKRIMQMVRDYGADVVLDASHLDVREAAYDIFVCMGYVTRRFDQKILKFLVDEGYIRLNSDRVEEKEIIEHLERYFFVKAQTVEGEGIVLRLHDEVARLVREHLWSSPDRAEEKQRLLISVIRLYDQMIKDAEDEDLQDTLRIEQLYYALERDPLDAGKRLWFDLADLDDEYINSLLPGEIKDYKKDFDPETRHEIHVRIAEMEYEAGHITQARGERELELELGKEAKRNDWIASALFGLANCERGAGKSLAAFQKARIFCEKHARGYLPRVYYNIGFAYRRLQDVEKAIRWYRKARKEFQKNSQDKALGAQIANDLGYAYSHVGNWGECRKNVKEGQKTRKSLLLQIEQEVNILEAKLKKTKSKTLRAKLHDDLKRKKNRLAKARFQLGLSYNTLGEIYRYDEDLDASLSNYTEAHELFKKVNNPRWQAKALFSRGETYRRIAWARYKEKDESGYVENIKRAEEDIQASLFLCERYRIKEERDTANRRMGRVLHDCALHELEKGNKQDARKFLEQAKYYFEQGLKYAVQTDEDLEELSNQTELVFLYDDFIRVIGRGKLPGEHRDALDNLKRALDKHRKNPFKVYQFPVFENLYKLEKAAVNYQARKYKQALKGYLEGYIGLAADPGYGRTRYKSHFSHLTRQIEKLPRREAEVWCKEFIKAWKEKRLIGRRKSTLAQEEIFPDLVQWCQEYLDQKLN